MYYCFDEWCESYWIDNLLEILILTRRNSIKLPILKIIFNFEKRTFFWKVRQLLHILYSSKFSWHNIFVNFVISLLITKIFLTKFSVNVGMATFCVRTRAHRDRSASANFQKMSNWKLPTKSVRTFVQNFLLVSNPPTITLKRWKIDDNRRC